ncbi:hypothetical protein N7540_003356 [Penicillium herquei]|nr:hypothetical protein N7540_003356 [Penicillium herquei]
MKGLRALCCSKGNQDDDDQHTPPSRPTQSRPEKETQSTPGSETTSTIVTQEKPTQSRPEKETQSTPGNGENETISNTVTQQKPAQSRPQVETEITQNTTKTDAITTEKKEKAAPRDLWKEAYEQLDPGDRKHVSGDGTATDAINGVIDDTTAKYEQWKNGGLRISQSNGNEINLRDTTEKIIGAAMKAQDVISTFVSFDPTGHASSAWTIISFGMSVVQNNLDRRDAIFASSEYLAENLAYYAVIDTNYRNKGVASDHYLDEALLKIYSAILAFTVEVKKARDEKAPSRALKSVFAVSDQALSTLKSAISDNSEAAAKWLTLSASLRDRKDAAVHLSKIKTIESKLLTAEEERQVSWISTAPYSRPQRESRNKRVGNTGDWLLETKEYNHWKSNPGELLWLPGISGCGKSVLCSTAIHDIEQDCDVDNSKYLVYWYFRFGDDMTQSVDPMIRSLIRQLSRSPLAESVTELWKKNALKGSELESDAISELFLDVVSRITGEIYLVIDALDECPENAFSSERGLALSFLMDTLERFNKKVHILVTSRQEYDIEKKLGAFPRIDLEASLAKDVESFVARSIEKSLLKDRLDQKTKDLIMTRLLSSKERRFRWAELQIIELKQCLGPEEVEEVLNAVPETLEDAYRQVLNRIKRNRDKQLARDVFMTICCSPIALDLNLVAAIVGVSFPDSIPMVCTTQLVSVYEEQIRFAHFSVQEFLIVPETGGPYHECQFSQTSGHMFLLTKTLNCLLEQRTLLTKTEVKAKAKGQAFFLYAAKYWNTNLAALGDLDQLSSEMQDKIDGIFTEPNVYYNWVRGSFGIWRFSDDVEENSSSLEEYDEPLYQASSMGLFRTVTKLLNQDADHDAESMAYRYGRAVQAASNKGHEMIVRLLFDRGADVNTEAGRYGGALQLASAGGYENIVRLLLDQGAEVDADGLISGTALQAASKKGHENIVRLLLDHKADVNAQGGEHGSPLKAAIWEGHENIVELLLDQGAEFSTQRGYHETTMSAFSAAVYLGRANIVQILLDRGADLSAYGLFTDLLQTVIREGHEEILGMLLSRAPDMDGQETINCADFMVEQTITCGNESIMQMLLDRGVDVNTQLLSGKNILQTASFKGQANIVQLLLDRDADINAHPEGSSALLIAIFAEHKEIVQMLLDHGAELNTQEASEMTELQAASSKGFEEIVRILLDRGADVNMQGGEYGNALQAASAEGYKQIMQLLLDRGAKVNAQGGKYGNALLAVLSDKIISTTSPAESEEMAQLLLRRGADVNAQGGEYPKSALEAASYSGYKDTVQMLLDRGADVNAEGVYINSLAAALTQGHKEIAKVLLDRVDINKQGEESVKAVLEAAISGGSKETVQLLLDHGVKINAQGGESGTAALQIALSNGYEEIVQLLLDRGVDVNSQGGQYGNALQAASLNGNEKAVKMLLDRGAKIDAQGGEFGSTALQSALSNGYEEIVQLLLDRGADVNAQAGTSGSALQAASINGNEEAVKMLLDRGADINAQGGICGNALQAASSDGNEEIMQILLDRGADVNAQGGEHGNALQAASLNGNGEAVKMLLDRGADFNAQGGAYGSALQAASSNGKREAVEILLDQGADVNAQGGKYGSALQAATYEGYERVARILLGRGADINAQGGEYGSAIQIAMSDRRGWHTELLPMLVEEGANLNTQAELDRALQIALRLAEESRSEETICVLLDRGANLDTQAELDRTLRDAVDNMWEETVRILLDRGADFNAPVKFGDTALQIAIEFASSPRYKGIVAMLRERGAEIPVEEEQ